jgi:S-methylmethionine-dependent homocysteine/selenocysteine methylase
LSGYSELERRLAAGEVVLLDGATGTELQARGVAMHEEAWSGAALLEHSSLLQDIHEDYVRAGADVITANTFSCNRYMLEPAGLAGSLGRLNTEAVAVALRAREVAKRWVAVAGSISGFMARPGEPEWNNVATVRSCVLEQAEILARAGADIILLEMMEQVEFLAVTFEAAASIGLPVWLGVSGMRREDGTLGVFDFPSRDLFPLLDAAVATGSPVINVMHSTVNDTGPILEELRRRFDGIIGVYPNSGYFKMPDWHFESIISPQQLATEATTWVVQGAQILGGCCGLGPAHIRALSALSSGEAQQ